MKSLKLLSNVTTFLLRIKLNTIVWFVYKKTVVRNQNLSLSEK